ncbi:hypothetical protein ADIS_4375 [Lunatimonas lonarensis]|uniref:Uncharacterized protein n=1 Tax=Lunatimonas lonarensis TaxID=1232681 RepID=R7ZMG8_9BACT|nr:hypothetical protein ADIS_4375 [Lunatimonas lonarensis]
MKAKMGWGKWGKATGGFATADGSDTEKGNAGSRAPEVSKAEAPKKALRERSKGSFESMVSWVDGH